MEAAYSQRIDVTLDNVVNMFLALPFCFTVIKRWSIHWLNYCANSKVPLTLGLYAAFERELLWPPRIKTNKQTDKMVKIHLLKSADVIFKSSLK